MKTINTLIQQLVVSAEAKSHDVMFTLHESPAKVIILSAADNKDVVEELTAEEKRSESEKALKHFKILKTSTPGSASFVLTTGQSLKNRVCCCQERAGSICVFQIDFKDKRSAPHRIEVYAIDIVCRSDGGRSGGSDSGPSNPEVEL